MRAVLRLLLLIWATVSAVSLVCLIYVFPGYSPRQCILLSIAKSPKPASIVLVSLVNDFPFGRCLHDGVVVPYSPQTLRQTVEIRLTHYPFTARVNDPETGVHEI